MKVTSIDREMAYNILTLGLPLMAIDYDQASKGDNIIIPLVMNQIHFGIPLMFQLNYGKHITNKGVGNSLNIAC